MVGFSQYGYRTPSESAIDNEVPLYFSGQNKQAISRVAPSVADDGLDVYADEIRQEHAGGKILRAGSGTDIAPAWKLDLTINSMILGVPLGLGPVATPEAPDSGAFIYSKAGGGVWARSEDGLEVRLSEEGTTGAAAASLTPEDFGAKGDAMRVNGAITAVGSVNVEVNTAPFIAEDVGKYIAIDGAGTAGACHVSTIVSVIDASHITIASPAVAVVGGPAVLFGTDNSTAFAAMRTAILAMQVPRTSGSIEVVLSGAYITGNLNWTHFSGVTIRGVGAAAYYPYSAVLVPKAGMTGTFVDISGCRYVRLQSFIIGRPDQNEWAPGLNVGLLAAGELNSETTAFRLDDLYVTGTYSIAGTYCEKLNQILATGCFFYNYHPTGRGMVITASNRDSVTSSYVTVNAMTWGLNWHYRLVGCQFIDASYIANPSVRTGGICLDVDGTYGLSLETCQFIGNNVGLRIADVDTTPARTTKGLTLDACVWEQPNAGGAIPEMNVAIQLASNVETYGLVIREPRFRVSGAWIQDAAGAGTTTRLKEAVIESPFSYLGTESAILINQTSSGSGYRLIGCTLSLGGRGVTVVGSIDPTTQLRNYGTLATTGGDMLAVRWDPNRPWFVNGLILSTSILDANGSLLLVPQPIGSAVNHIGIANAATGNPPAVMALGSNPDINLGLYPKGSGQIVNLNTGRPVAEVPIPTASLAANATSQAQTVSSTDATTTDSTSYADMVGMSITMTTTGGPVLVTFTGTIVNSGFGAGNFIAARVDSGADNELCSQANNVSGGRNAMSGAYLFTGLSAASHAFTIRWKVDAGTATPLARTMVAVEFKR